MQYLCEGHHKKCHTFIQPIAFINKNLTQNEIKILKSSKDWEAKDQYIKTYQKMIKEIMSLKSANITDLTDIFKKHQEDIYLDITHYLKTNEVTAERRGNTILIQKIARILAKKWNFKKRANQNESYPSTQD